MACVQIEPRRLSVEEYLALESAGDCRHEFIDGEIYRMPDEGERYGAIALGLANALNAHVRAPHEVFIADMKLRVNVDHAEMFYYPDVMVSRYPVDRAPAWREKPTLIIEVATPATRRVDHGEKLSVYTSIETLLEYVIVARDSPRVEVFRRSAGWSPSHLGESDLLEFRSVGLTMPVSRVYRRVNFSQPTFAT